MSETEAWRGARAWTRAAAGRPVRRSAADPRPGRLWALLRARALLDGMPGAADLAEDDRARLAARTRQH
jgi:hypothetical protein